MIRSKCGWRSNRFSPRVKGWLEAASDVWLWGLFRHPVAKHWFGQNAAILGDAAHPTLPFLAQGANMALEDAWVLADCLDRLGLTAGLAAYQSARQFRCARIVQAANDNAQAYHLRRTAARAGASGAAAGRGGGAGIGAAQV